MNEQVTHAMILQDTHASGAEEWYCPQCGRRFIMQWPPNYKRVILEAGDEYAYHTASKGGLHMHVQIEPGDNSENGSDQDHASDVGAFADWLDQLDFSDGPDKADQ